MSGAPSTPDPALPAAGSVPPTATEVFGDRLSLARRYAELLAGPGIERGLIGPREADRLWDRHLLNCALLGQLIPPRARVVDIGSGAGLPGIPLSLARPDCQVDLVEPLLRRAGFLSEVVEELNLVRCRVFRLRAEEAAAEVGGADVVTARAVAPLAKLVGWAAPLLRPGGILLAIKGSTAGDEIARDRAAVRRAGVDDLTVRTVGGPTVTVQTTVVWGRRSGRAAVRDGRSGPQR